MRKAKSERMALVWIVLAFVVLPMALASCASSGGANPSGEAQSVETASADEGSGTDETDASEQDAEPSDANEAKGETQAQSSRSSRAMSRAEDYRNSWENRLGVRSKSGDDAQGDGEGSEAKDSDSAEEDGTEGANAEGSASDAAALTIVSEPAPKTDRYTVMVYMVGSNLESTGGAASEDLQEMLSSGLDFSKTNVVVYTGGSRRWNSTIPADRNSVLDLSRAKDDRIVAQTQGTPSMGDASTLSTFLDFCADHYPAKHNALVFWDHGGGPLWGFGVDENASGDGLLLSELRDAMEESPFGAADAGATDKDASSSGLDWVGFDACLMGSLENAVLWSNYADWMVASEEVEPGDGWDWGFLSVLNQTDDASTVTKAVLDGYDAHYKDIANTFSNPDITLAALDLSHTDEVVDALDALVKNLDKDVKAGSYATVNRARHNAKAFGLSAVDSRSAAYDLVDLVDLAGYLEDSHPKEAKALASATQKLVANRVGNVMNANGVSLYFPGENRELFETFDEFGRNAGGTGRDASTEKGDDATDDSQASSSAKGDALQISTTGLAMLSTTYDSFVNSYTDAWLDFTQVDWTLAEPQITDDGLTLHLTDEQADAFLSASYTLLDESDEPGRYFALTSEVEIPLSDQQVTAPRDPLVICSKTDLHRAVPGWFVQVESTDDHATYVNRNLYLSPAIDFRDFDSTTDSRVAVTVDVDNKTNEVSISSVTASDESIGMGGRSSIDVTQYAGIFQMSFNGGMLHVRYDANDNPLPWDDWGSDGYLYYGMPVEDGFGFVGKPASQMLESYAVQIVVTDVNGNRHATAPIALQTGAKLPTEGKAIRQKTELGTLTLTVYNDHAEVTRYEGDDWTVEIPSEVEGKRVTAIAEDAFSNARYIDELTVPEGVEDIGAGAFSSSGMYTLTLPSSLKHVAPAAFCEMEQLTAFKLSGKSDLLSVQDGVLFSADGSVLLSYPNAKGTSYAVPKGTEVLSYGSFARTNIQKVTLPEGLRTIDRAAFYDCEALTEIELPQSLEQVGTLAFGLGYFADGANVQSVHLGPNVNYVGDRVFDGLNLQSIDVDPANTHYTSKGGCLLNAAGDALLEAPTGMGKVVEVPEGVVSLAENAFYWYDDNTEFILPASIVTIDETSLPYSLQENEDGSYETVHTCVIHTPAGSFAERFAEDRGIAHDNNTDRAQLVYTMQQVEQGDYVLEFRLYADRAVLTGVGTDSGSAEHDLTIPDQVEGKPVTELSLSSIAYPDGYSSPWDVKTLSLPASLQTVSNEGLSAFDNLQSVSFDGKCPAFQALDGVLYSSDGDTLVAYPAGRVGDYEVPDGTVTIADYAFKGAGQLTELTLPDSLESIGEEAFDSCDELVTVHFGNGLREVGEGCFSGCNKLALTEPLPSRLRTIGKYAFMSIASYEGLELPKDVEHIGYGAFNGSYYAEKKHAVLPVTNQTLTIGRHLSSLDDDAFAGLGITEFKAKKNKYLRAEGPFLFTADGSKLVAFACGYEGDAVIPDGVHEVDFGLFECAYNLKSLTIPSSVTYFTGMWSIDNDDYPTFEVHVSEGSTAQRLAQEKGLDWITD